MLFAFHGVDRPDAADVRTAAHPEHAAYHEGRGNLVGGPLLDADGDPCGTLIIFEAADLAAAEAMIADDPYVRTALFESTSVRRFTAVDWPRAQRAT